MFIYFAKLSFAVPSSAKAVLFIHPFIHIFCEGIKDGRPLQSWWDKR